MSEAGVVIALVTGPDAATLETLADRIVAEKLAACVNLITGVRSVYRWDDEVRRDDEALAVVKTTRSAIVPLRDRIVELHPYEVPEFLVLSIESGSEAYLDWVTDCVTAPQRHPKADRVDGQE